MPYAYLAGNQRQSVSEWIDGWQWMTKSTLQQVCMSFPVGNEMEKHAPPMINLISLEPSPKISLWSFSQVSLVWRKTKWKMLCIWFSEIFSFWFTTIQHARGIAHVEVVKPWMFVKWFPKCLILISHTTNIYYTP